MNPSNASTLTTVTMYRRVRRGFVPPRRVTDEPLVPQEETSNPVPKKKRDLSPVFGKILKVIDKDNEGDRIEVVSSVEHEEETNSDPSVRRNLNDSVELKDDTSPKCILDQEDRNQDLENETEEDISQYFDDPMDSWNADENAATNEEDVGMADVSQVEKVKSLSTGVSGSAVPEKQPSTKDFLFKKPLTKYMKSKFNVGIEDESLGCSQGQQSQTQGSQSQYQSQESDDKRYFAAVFGKASTRKHKTFEDDGFITVTDGSSVTLKNSSGKVIESSKNYQLDSEILEESKVFKLGGKEVMIVEELTSNPFAKDDTASVPPVPILSTKMVAKLPTPLITKPFVSPVAPGAVLTTEKANRNPAKPMFNPDEEGALVMPVLDSSEDVRVVVDPHLSRHLREHQREGVTFLYKCVMNPNYSGAILGDEMGLGKTLQCITLLWTLIKQGPKQRKEIVKRALIVAPSSLVSNWEKEFHRWLGYERIRVFAVNSDHPLKQCPPQCPVIIMSYEMATRSEGALKKMRFDIIVCDEAHKIKNKDGQAYTFLSKLACRRRVLLTGTPVQNDLMELYALVNFANPGVLGTEQEFRKEYEKPIEKYQESHSTLLEKQIGQAKALQLNNILNNFFLRRTHNVMIRYLPPRVTYVVICKPSPLQVNLYKRILSLNVVQDCVTGSGNCSAPLSVILALKKLCNHPNLVHPKSNSAEKVEESLYNTLGLGFPQGHRHDLLKVEDSGKMKVLVSLLKNMKEQKQKVVIVSHYTQTLDLLENLCNMFSFGFKRLDGTTVAKQRQQIVDQFNNGTKEFAFLLSSKAGGLGLNLQGASNIILYDIDWNPAHDIQAMSRCWRPGQKNVTHIYRLLTSGSIEERIYHRQIAKQDLSGSVMDLLLSNSSVKFSPQDLKDIFSFYDGGGCLTHELIDCDCEMDGSTKDFNSSGELNFDDLDIENIPKGPPKKKLKSISTMAELHSWEHHGPPFNNLDQHGLQTAAKDIDFVFCSRSLSANGSQ